MNLAKVRPCCATLAFLPVFLSTSVGLADGDPRPDWRARRRRGVQPNYMAAERVDPEDWPREPASPREIDAPRLASALRSLCGSLSADRAHRYARWVSESSAEFDEDPFLIGALMHRQSGCRPDAEELGGLGLTLIPWSMYANHGLARGAYTYKVWEGGRWATRVKRMDRFPFAEPRLLRAEENIYFTAAILSVWRDQHRTVDRAFEQPVAHRHHVSHFFWGDRVRSDRDEDGVLTDRRRLLKYYGAWSEPPPKAAEGLRFGCPLDGCPRVVSSGLGAERDGGAREHRGADVEAVFGEPVRAIESGAVSFVGVDYPGSRNHVAMRAAQVLDVPRQDLGSGGRFVCINHPRPNAERLRSCYMHLETIAVEIGQQVARGALIGTVGRTGMQSSAPHLHLEVHDTSGVRNPLEVLAGILIGTPTP